MHTAEKIASQLEACDKMQEWKSQGLELVFTNGCFDIVHLGHIDYLEKAKSLGDRLVVGLNSDDSVKRLKGPERPINDVYARARMLAALGFVDMVVVFDEDTPLNLIKMLMPTVLVKGSDYQVDNIVGAKEVLAAGGSVKTIDLVDGYSTTLIINKLKNKPS